MKAMMRSTNDMTLRGMRKQRKRRKWEDNNWVGRSGKGEMM